MCRKITSIIVFICFLTLSNFALGAQFNWQGSVSNDWFDPLNWEPNGVPTYGDRACIQGRAVPPVIVDTSAPENVPDACALSIEIIPWAWEAGQGEDWTTFTINSGWVDCNCLSLSTQTPLPTWSEMTGVLVVNDGLLTMHNEVPAYGNENAPPGPGYGGRGLWIGGGESTWENAWGHVRINGGTVRTPKIAIYNGDITINGGLLYDTNSSLSEFTIRDTWPRNKIYINGGTLGLAGSRVTQLTDFINARRIVSLRGAFVGPTYNASALPEPNTTLSSDVNLGPAWQPSPENLITDVHYHLTGGLKLSWKAGDWIGEPNINEPNNGHYVFLGTVFNDVSNAGVGPLGTAATAVYRGHVNQSEDDTNDPNLYIPETGVPPEVNLIPNKVYYWRVDEVNDLNDAENDPCHFKGIVWQFKTVSCRASNPSPADVVGGLKMPLELTWTAGDWSPTTHWVYFGTSQSDVDNALPSSGKPVYRGTVNSPVYPLSKLLESPGYTLARNTTYYWRVDEADYLGKIPGEGGFAGYGFTWSFNTGSSISIDDFQSYDFTDLNSVWKVGVPVCSGVSGSGRIALVREGQSTRYMQFTYDKSGGGGRYFSETSLPYIVGVNWTTGGVFTIPPGLLELSYRGFATNSSDSKDGYIYDRMYVAVEDTGGDVNIVLNPDPNAQLKGPWTTWAIAYNELGSGQPGQADLNNVSDLYLGAGLRCAGDFYGGGDGNVMFDNIRVLSSTCVPEFGPIADFDGNCIVDLRDLDILAADWLVADISRDWTLTQKAPKDPILWYQFNETGGTTVVSDSAPAGADPNAPYNGSVLNLSPTLTWDTDGSRNGTGCIYLPAGQQSYVEGTTSGNPLWWVAGTDGISFSIWANADMTAYSTFSGWSGILGTWRGTAETLEIHCPSPWPPGYQWGPSCNFINKNPNGGTAGTGIRPFGDFGGRWNNWIFIKDNASTPEEMRVYLNGLLVADVNSIDAAGVAGSLFPATVTSFRIGTRGGNWGMWAGRLDDLKVFNYALSEDEIHYIATDGTGILFVPTVSPANIKKGSTPEIVNFGDLALMVDEWMTEKLWP